MNPASRIRCAPRADMRVQRVRSSSPRSVLASLPGHLLPTTGTAGAWAVAAVLLTTPALADDKAACSAGIADIKAKVAALAPDAVPPKLKKALRVAEREQGEGEYDECVEALEDANRALPR
jgi:hypothetical protein